MKKKSPSLIINLRKWNKDVNSLCEHCLVVEDTSSIFYINVRSPAWYGKYFEENQFARRFRNYLENFDFRFLH